MFSGPARTSPHVASATSAKSVVSRPGHTPYRIQNDMKRTQFSTAWKSRRTRSAARLSHVIENRRFSLLASDGIRSKYDRSIRGLRLFISMRNSNAVRTRNDMANVLTAQTTFRPTHRQLSGAGGKGLGPSRSLTVQLGTSSSLGQLRLGHIASRLHTAQLDAAGMLAPRGP